MNPHGSESSGYSSSMAKDLRKHRIKHFGLDPAMAFCQKLPTAPKSGGPQLLLDPSSYAHI